MNSTLSQTEQCYIDDYKQESAFTDHLSQPTSHAEVKYHYPVIELGKGRPEKISDVPAITREVSRRVSTGPGCLSQKKKEEEKEIIQNKQPVCCQTDLLFCILNCF